jgi:hypothetical protein
MLFASALLVLAPPPQSAVLFAPVEGPAQLRWRYLQAEAAVEHVDVAGEDSAGLAARGAWDFGRGVFVLGGVEGLSGDVDLSRYDAGLGFHKLLHGDLDLFVSASWVREVLDGSGATDFDDEGWRALGGARRLFSPSWEGEVRAGWQDVADQGYLLGATLRWWWQEDLSLGVSYDHSVDDDALSLSLRWAL